MVAVIVVAVVIAADDAWVWSDAVDGWQTLFAAQTHLKAHLGSKSGTASADTNLLA